MKTLTIISAIFLLASLYLPSQAQPARIEYGDNLFEKHSYAKAVEVFEKLYEKGEQTPEIIKKIAYSYKAMNNIKEAQKWYAKLMNTSSYEASDIFNYVNILKSMGNYEAADKWLREFYKLQENVDSYAGLNEEALAKLMVSQKYYDVEYLPINSPNSDFGATYYRDKVVFASARNEGNTSGIYEWNNQPFLDFYECRRDEDGDLSFLNRFSEVINTDYHESSATFNESGTIMYFTRNNFSKGRVHKGKNGDVNLKIYKAKKKDGEWKNESALPFNSDNYSCGHPSLSADGKKLYFSSDMPGGYGGSDIYVSSFSAGKWGKPENLGEVVNTPGNETFPFIHSNGELYFSSDGHIGLGSLDVFVAKNEDGEYTEVSNLGVPINSSMDDFGFIMEPSGKQGYLSSNRFSDGTDDNLYKFTIRDFILKGTVRDKITSEILPNAPVILFDNENNVVDKISADDQGNYSFVIDPNKKYSISGNYKFYLESGKEELEIGKPKEPVFEHDILLDPASFAARGYIAEELTNKIIPDATITLIDLYDGSEVVAHSDESGEFGFNLEPDKRYKVLYEKDKYFSKSRKFNTQDVKPGVIDISELLAELVLDKAIKLENIYYDYNKANIRSDAAVELDKLVQILVDNPKISIELSSHTDSRGSDKYNMSLSDKRAKSAAKYIISKGIDKDRIVGKGYGESKLINQCVNGAQCKDEDHQANRRTEFKVTKIIE